MSKPESALRRAFTLIELLVVIAIIAILASILFPVFARARENARRSSCQSNLKQLALGVVQYTQDFDERYPLLVIDSSQPGMFETGASFTPYSSAVTWCDRIMPYVKSQQVFYCPSVSKSNSTTYNFRAFSHYGINIFISKTFNRDFYKQPILEQFPVSSVQRASEVVMLADTRVQQPDIVGSYIYSSNFQNPLVVNYVAFPGCNAVSPVFDPVSGRHLEGSNYAFLDGHVKWMRVQKGDGVSIADVSAAYGVASYSANANDITVDWTLAANASAKNYWAVNR